MTFDGYDHLRESADADLATTGPMALPHHPECPACTQPDLFPSEHWGRALDHDHLGALIRWADADRYSEALVGGDLTRHRLATWALFSYPSPLDVLDFRASRWAAGR